MEHKIKVDEKEHALDGQNKMNSFRREKKHCDLIIKVESEEISVHRNVICSRSDYFDAMFSHDTKEKRTGVVEIKGVDQECTVKCVDFMYTGETSIRGDKCGELMHVATLFQLLTLCNAIAAFLEKKLDCKSFFATKHLADLYSCQKLMDACNKFALKHFQEIVQLGEFNQLDGDYIKFLVGAKNMKASEGSKCKAVIDWVKHDLSSRKTFLFGLLEKLDLTNIPLSYRGFLTEHESLIYSSGECMKLLATSFLKTMKVKSKDMAHTDHQEIVILDDNSKTLRTYNVDTKTWGQKQNLEDEMLGQSITLGVAVLDDYLYILAPNKTFFRLLYTDPDATWERMPDRKFVYGIAVVLNGLIYTSDYGAMSTKMERFDPRGKKWTDVPDKQLECGFEALACATGKIFSISGRRQYVGLCTYVEIYDPASSSWTFDTPLNQARQEASATTVEDGIYVLGGFNNGSFCDVEYRCPRSKTWTVITPMKSPRHEFSSFFMNGKIFAVGGEQSDSKTIEEYDIEAKEWKITERMDKQNVKPLAAVALPV